MLRENKTLSLREYGIMQKEKSLEFLTHALAEVGFSPAHARRACLATNLAGVPQAIEWALAHLDEELLRQGFPAKNEDREAGDNGLVVELPDGKLFRLMNSNGRVVEMPNGSIVEMIDGQVVEMSNGQQLKMVDDSLLEIRPANIALDDGEIVGHRILSRQENNHRPEQSETSLRWRTIGLIRASDGSLGLRFRRQNQATDGPFEVIELVANGVAERSGEVQVGDKIYAVDGHDAQRRSKEEVKSLFCGRPGTLLTLTILGSGGPVLGNEFKELMLERMQGVKIMVKEVQNLRFPKRTPQEGKTVGGQLYVFVNIDEKEARTASVRTALYPNKKVVWNQKVAFPSCGTTSVINLKVFVESSPPVLVASKAIPINALPWDSLGQVPSVWVELEDAYSSGGRGGGGLAVRHANKSNGVALESDAPRVHLQVWVLFKSELAQRLYDNPPPSSPQAAMVSNGTVSPKTEPLQRPKVVRFQDALYDSVLAADGSESKRREEEEKGREHATTDTSSRQPQAAMAGTDTTSQPKDEDVNVTTAEHGAGGVMAGLVGIIQNELQKLNILQQDGIISMDSYQAKAQHLQQHGRLPEAGVGMTIRERHPFSIEDLRPGGPAAKAGVIKIGDEITKVDGCSLRESLTGEQVRTLVIGPVGSVVELQFREVPKRTERGAYRVRLMRQAAELGGTTQMSRGDAMAPPAGMPPPPASPMTDNQTVAANAEEATRSVSEPTAWSVEEVASFLRSLCFTDAAAIAQDNQVDGKTLLDLTDADLTEHLGLRPLQTRRLRKEIEGLTTGAGNSERM